MVVAVAALPVAIAEAEGAEAAVAETAQCR